MQAAFREKGASYVKWAAKMAVGLQTGVPWIMCKQPDAPDPVVCTLTLVPFTYLRAMFNLLFLYDVYDLNL